MADPVTPIASPPSTARSSAIYKQLDLVCDVINAEIAHAVHPYEQTVRTLNEQLGKLAAQLESAERKNAQLEKNASSGPPEQAEKDLVALKTILAESGIGLTTAGGRPTLCFVGERAKLVSQIDQQAKHLVPEPAQYKPISPSSVVAILLACVTECSSRLTAALSQSSTLSRECTDLKEAGAKRDAEIDEATRRWETRCLELEKSVEAEQKSLSEVRGDLEVRLLAARTQADKWKMQYETVEAARDTLKDALDASDAKFASSQTELDLWKGKCLAAETAQDEGAAKSSAMQLEIDRLTGECLAMEGKLKALTKERDDALKAAEVQGDTWKVQARTAGEQRDAARDALRDAKADLAKHQDATKTKQAGWEEKGRAWEAERTRLEDQHVHDASVIADYKSTYIPNLEAKLLEAEMARDELQSTLSSENAKSLAGNAALKAEIEELKKKRKLPAKPSAPKTPSTMFINKPGVQLPEKPPSLPAKPGSLPATTAAAGSTQGSQSAPVMGLQAGVAVRRASAGSPVTPVTLKQRVLAGGSPVVPVRVNGKAHAPPPATSGGVLAGAAPISRAAPRVSASAGSSSVEDSLAVSKRRALSSQSNASPSNANPSGSLKRSAPSPLVSEPAKIARTTSTPQARPVALNTTPSRTFSKPPTLIAMPSQPRRSEPSPNVTTTDTSPAASQSSSTRTSTRMRTPSTRLRPP